MDGKRIRCLQIIPLHVPIYLLPFLRYSEIFMKKSSFYHTPLHSTPPLGGFPSEYRHPLCDEKTRMASLPDGEKNSKISLFVLTSSTNVTDGRTDRRTYRQTLRDSIDRACIASRGKNRHFIIPRLHSTPPLGGSRRNIGTLFGTEKLEWCRYPIVKKFRRYVYSFWRDPRT